MRIYQKSFVSFLIAAILLLSLSACASDEEEQEQYIYWHNGAKYTFRDPFDNPIDSWCFPNLDRTATSTVKVFFGPESDSQKVPNRRVKKFDDPAFNMLLMEWGDLLCKEGYLPNYHDVEEIEDIYFVFPDKDYNVDFWGEKAKSVGNRETANILFQEIKAASESSEWYENSSPEEEEHSEFDELSIGFKFDDVIAIFPAGFISKTEPGKWGLYLYDKQPYELYLLSDEAIQIIKNAK